MQRGLSCIAACLLASLVAALAAARGSGRMARTKPASPPPTRASSRPLSSQSHSPPAQGSRPTLALQVGHSAPILRLAFSPDGQTLATASEDGQARLWDVRSGLVKALLRGHSSWVVALAISPDSRTLVTGSGSAGVQQGAFISTGEARLWDTGNGRLKAVLPGHRTLILACAFTADGTTLATGGVGFRTENGKTTAFDEVRLWDVGRAGPAPSLRAVLRGKPLPGIGAPGMPTYALAFSPDGRILATASVDSIPRLWESRTGKLKAALDGHLAGVKALAFSPNGRWLATGGDDGSARLWDVASGRLAARLPARTRSVSTLAFSADGTTLATGGDCVQLWKFDPAAGGGGVTLQPEITLPAPREGVAALGFSPDNQVLATAGGGEARLWDRRTGLLKAALQGHRSLVTSLAFSPDGSLLATASYDHTARLWDARSGEPRTILQGQGPLVRRFAFCRGGTRLITVCDDGSARLWETGTGQLRATLAHAAGLSTAAISPDGRTVATGGGTMRAQHPSGEVRLWDAGDGQLKRTLAGLPGAVSALAFSPDGRLLAGGGSYGDGAVRTWDAQSGSPAATMEGRSNAIWSLAFSPDGRLLAAGCGDRTARLWDARSGQLLATMPGHPYLVSTLAFSPDGRTLATGSADRTLRLWDVPGGQAKRSLPGVPVVFVRTIAFSSDGKRIAAAPDDGGSVLVWNVAGGEPIRTDPHSGLASFAPYVGRVVRAEGTAAELRDPLSGRALATLLPLPEVEMETAAARPIELGARPIELGARAAEGAGEWFVTTPEGYFDCSANAAKFIRWNLGGHLYPAERYLRRFRRPDLVQKALRGEPITAPAMTLNDVPPSARFVWVKYDGPAQKGTVNVTVQAEGRHEPKEMVLLVNGRPLPPERAKPVVTTPAASILPARPIELGSKPIELGARPIELGAKPIELGSRPAGSRTSQTRTTATITKRFTFQVSLPQGAETVRLRAVTYDQADLGSSPVEIELRRPGVKPVPGNLYALCVGVSRYRNGRGAEIPGSRVPGYLPEGEVWPNLPATGAGQFSNLKFPSVDALSMAGRLQKEGRPLYEQVEVRTLVDEQATLANVRAGLRWLQEKARPGQVDTVVVYLSGHGVSDARGGYHFPTYEFDRKNVNGSSLSGEELQQALGGALRAKAVFLFVDTCHSGALAGARGDDLTFEVTSSGVYMMASSGATQYSYESPAWGHGAFTYALLRSLARPELAREGIIHFNVLTYAVPEELMAMLKEAGQNPGAMEPVVPLEGRRLDEPVAQPGR